MRKCILSTRDFGLRHYEILACMISTSRFNHYFAKEWLRMPRLPKKMEPGYYLPMLILKMVLLL